MRLISKVRLLILAVVLPVVGLTLFWYTGALALFTTVVDPTLFLFCLGAVSTTQAWRNNDAVEYTIIATADGDTVTASIAHGMGANPKVSILPILQVAASLSLWAATTIDATNVVLTKATTAGSGVAGAQIRLRVERSS